MSSSKSVFKSGHLPELEHRPVRHATIGQIPNNIKPRLVLTQGQKLWHTVRILLVTQFCLLTMMPIVTSSNETTNVMPPTPF